MNVQLEVRKFGQGKKAYSIQARIWNPQKKFYEHPTLINLSKITADQYLIKLKEQNIDIDEIVNNWVYVGN